MMLLLGNAIVRQYCGSVRTLLISVSSSRSFARASIFAGAGDGMRTQNAAPSPGFDRAVIEPPWSFTSAIARLKPIPVPPAARLRAVSAR